MSWAINFGDMTSNLADMGRWASALGKATLLSPAARAQFFAPVTSTLGPFNRTTYYALGTLINDGWVLCNPNVPGYWDALGYNAKSGLAIVVISTPTAASPQNVHYSVAALTQLAKEAHPVAASDLALLTGCRSPRLDGHLRGRPVAGRWPEAHGPL